MAIRCRCLRARRPLEAMLPLPFRAVLQHTDDAPIDAPLALASAVALVLVLALPIVTLIIEPKVVGATMAGGT